MNNKISWIFLLTLFILIIGYYVISPLQPPAGDIVEYYGITESIISHKGLNLMNIDQANLEKILSPEYFKDPQYYVTNQKAIRFPVHFFFYSLLLIPFRIFFQSVGLNPMLTFPITNTVIVFLTIAFIYKFFIKNDFQRMVLCILVLISPFLSFLSWYGPDVMIMSLLLVSIFLFFSGKHSLSALLVVIASWHSQPLALLSIIFIGISFLKDRSKKNVVFLLINGLLLIAPYIYNIYAFGAITPWIKFANGWTQLNGFGIQNISLLKLYEQFFDFNIGLFWYTPILFLLSLWSYAKLVRENKLYLFVSFVCVIVALAYQMNPAWHYGTAGYGPTRHILFMIPLLIYFAYKLFKPSFRFLLISLILIIVQTTILIGNGFLSPDFTKTLYHTELAKFVLNIYPQIYNPTPQIFIDRTTHTNKQSNTKQSRFIISAVYKNGSLCKKAYVLPADRQWLLNSCGEIPKGYSQALESISTKKWYQGIYVNY